MRDAEKGGSRIAIVHNGSPLFTGAAGSGESEIRRYIIENDLLEAIVALPEQLFYNTGIAIVRLAACPTARAPERRGKVQLIDAREQFVKMRKSLGEKRREISAEQIDEITRLHGAFAEGDRVKIVDERVLRLPDDHRRAAAARLLAGRPGRRGTASPGRSRLLAKLDDAARAALIAAPARDGRHATRDGGRASRGDHGRRRRRRAAEARRTLREGARRACARPRPGRRRSSSTRRASRCPTPTGATPRTSRSTRTSRRTSTARSARTSRARGVPTTPGKVGYEIPFTRLFYKYTPPRPSAEIKAELKELEGEIHRLLAEVVGE